MGTSHYFHVSSWNLLFFRCILRLFQLFLLGVWKSPSLRWMKPLFFKDKKTDSPNMGPTKNIWVPVNDYCVIYNIQTEMIVKLSKNSGTINKSQVILLMDEILHQLVGGSSHYLQGFTHPRWCRILYINSLTHTSTDRWKVLWVVAGQRRHPWISLHVNQDDDQGGLQQVVFKPSWTHETKLTHTWVAKVFFVKKTYPAFCSEGSYSYSILWQTLRFFLGGGGGGKIVRHGSGKAPLNL